jgi:hypothetical protein
MDDGPLAMRVAAGPFRRERGPQPAPAGGVRCSHPPPRPARPATPGTSHLMACLDVKGLCLAALQVSLEADHPSGRMLAWFEGIVAAKGVPWLSSSM